MKEKHTDTEMKLNMLGRMQRQVNKPSKNNPILRLNLVLLKLVLKGMQKTLFKLGLAKLGLFKTGLNTFFSTINLVLVMLC